MKMPYSGWPRDPRLKEIGKYNAIKVVPEIEAYALSLFTRAHGMDPKDVQEHFASVAKEIGDKKKQIYQYVYVSFPFPQ